jgi:hypothetical protein
MPNEQANQTPNERASEPTSQVGVCDAIGGG